MSTVIDRFKTLADKLQGTAGRLQKEAYLREVADDGEVLEVLKFLFDPYVVSGISDKKLNKLRAKELPLLTLMYPANTNADFLDALGYFRKHNTGRDEDVLYLIEIAEKTRHAELVYSVIKRDLKLGIQATTLNKVFGDGFVPKFDVMLAESYAENREFIAGKEFIITEKLDGVRCLLMFNDGTPTFYSRQGQAILDLVELFEQVKDFPSKYVYDGELLLHNAKKLPSKDLYRATVKVTSSDGPKRGLVYYLFDVVDKEAFLRGEDNTPAKERKLHVQYLVSDSRESPNIDMAQMPYIGTDVAEIEKWLDFYVKKDGEGIMVNVADGAYQCKRSKNLLKVKQFNTADVEVVELEEGGGANRGKLGAVVVRFIGPDGKHHTCKVGSGFKLEEREHFWKNPDEIKGKIIEIGYFELSRNQNDDNYSLRFPTFKHLRPDKTEISMH